MILSCAVVYKLIFLQKSIYKNEVWYMNSSKLSTNSKKNESSDFKFNHYASFLRNRESNLAAIWVKFMIVKHFSYGDILMGYQKIEFSNYYQHFLEYSPLILLYFCLRLLFLKVFTNIIHSGYNYSSSVETYVTKFIITSQGW